VTEVRAAPNASEDGAGARRFRIVPELLLRAHREARARGLEVVGFYHSHPDAEARPSTLDREHAWPGYSYLIVGVVGGRPRELRSWRMEALGGTFGEEAVADDGPSRAAR
jgi:proteasome lid subunit RPN8/RPN11